MSSIASLDGTSLGVGITVALLLIAPVFAFILRWQKQRLDAGADGATKANASKLTFVDTRQSSVSGMGESAQVISKVTELIGVLTDDKGRPTLVACGQSQEVVAEHEKRFDGIQQSLGYHETLHRKQFSALRKLDRGQREIMDYLTSTNGNGGGGGNAGGGGAGKGPSSSYPPDMGEPVSETIDAESTSEIHIDLPDDRLKRLSSQPGPLDVQH